MRLFHVPLRGALWAALWGWAIGIVAGLMGFFVVMLWPGQSDDLGGGMNLVFILVLFAPAFMAVGCVVGSLIGFLLGIAATLASGREAPPKRLL